MFVKVYFSPVSNPFLKNPLAGLFPALNFQWYFDVPSLFLISTQNDNLCCYLVSRASQAVVENHLAIWSALHIWRYSTYRFNQLGIKIFGRKKFQKISKSEIWVFQALTTVMDREASCAAVHGVTKSQTWLSDWTELILAINSHILYKVHYEYWKSWLM